MASQREVNEQILVAALEPTDPRGRISGSMATHYGDINYAYNGLIVYSVEDDKYYKVTNAVDGEIQDGGYEEFNSGGSASWDDVKPEGGVTENDLSKSVQKSLGLAESSLQEDDLNTPYSQNGQKLTFEDVVTKLFYKPNTISTTQASAINNGSFGSTNTSQSGEYGSFYTYPIKVSATASYNKNQNGEPTTNIAASIPVNVNFKVNGKDVAVAKTISLSKSNYTYSGEISVSAEDVKTAAKAVSGTNVTDSTDATKILVIGDSNNRLVSVTCGTITEQKITFASRQVSATGGKLKSVNVEIEVSAEGSGVSATVDAKSFTTSFGSATKPTPSISASRYWFSNTGTSYPTTSAAIRGNNATNVTTKEKTLTPSSGHSVCWFAIPSTMSKSNVTYNSSPKQDWTSMFTKVASNVEVKGANSLCGVNYDVWAYDAQTDISGNTLTIKIA